MKHIRNSILLALLALACLVLLRNDRALAKPCRVWVGGVELTDGGSLPGADYDPASNTLTLRGAELSGSFRGAVIYAEGDLALCLEGTSTASGAKSGCTVLGDLTVCGSGSLLLEGSRCGAAVHGCAIIYDSAELTLSGRKPLRWGRLHVSPLDTVEERAGRLRILAPVDVLLTDGAADAAGHALTGEPTFRRLAVKLDTAIPVPAEPERAGYWFGGWFADEALEQPFDFSQPVQSGPVTVYARWIRIVTLRFDSWGGRPCPDALYAWGDVPAPPAEEPVREGFRFVGWYGDDGLREEYDWSAPLESDGVAYARWEKIADYTLRGIDAARYQGAMDWDRVRESGVSFVFLRAGFRGYGSEGKLNTDDNFETNYAGAAEAGMDVGVYFFSQAISEEEAQAEARYVLELLGGRALDLPVVMDFELASDANGLLGRLYEANLSGEDYARICLAFCSEIERNGYTAAVYAGTGILRDQVGDALRAGGYPVWLAHWTVQTSYDGPFDYWQYSGSGHVDGIGPEVDLDMRYADIPSQVTGLTVSRGEGYNFLYWDRVPGVQSYIVCRGTPGGGYAEVARRSGAGTVSFTDRGAPADSTYMVCACIRVNGRDVRGLWSELTEAAP